MKNSKPTPRNLTARFLRSVAGNPVTTSLDSAVANCFPGLEYDVRTLDNRFFPGLVFQFVQVPYYPVDGALPNQQGAHLVYLDFLLDPMLPETSPEPWVQELLDKYREPLTTTLMKGRWYLDWIEQGGKRLSMTDLAGTYFDGYCVSRLIRGLEPDLPLKIGLAKRDLPAAPAIELTGRRRRYLDAAGIYDEAYRPGEFTQSMCNPWHHDFRDCACHYWATHHPDVVIRDPDPATQLPNGIPSDPVAASTYVDWLRRREPSADVAAAGTIGANRPFQIDHYEINKIWESLPFVLEGQEISGDYCPSESRAAAPFPSTARLIRELETVLGPLEIALALQYLYALFSLKQPEEVRDSEFAGLADDLAGIRQQLLLVAVGEMIHLRWVNQILWELDRCGLGHEGWHYTPILHWNNPPRTTDGKLIELRPMTPDMVDRFIEVERPAGGISRAYEKCRATLEDPRYPKHLHELAARIDDDGIGHFQRFRSIKSILGAYAGKGGEYPYLRKQPHSSGPEVDKVLEWFAAVRRHLADGFRLEASRAFPDAEARIQDARESMRHLQQAAETAAINGFSVPFFDAPGL